MLVEMLSETFREVAANLVKLADLQKTDPDLKTPEAVELQGLEERLWPNLSIVEMSLIQSLSADLWYLHDEGPHPKSREPSDTLQAHFIQAKVDNALPEIAKLLHLCPKLATGVEGARIRHFLWESLGQEEVANRFKALQDKVGIRLLFRTLRDQWKKDTQLLSLIDSDHPAYQKVIQMGMPVVPIILEELRDNPDWWGPALQAITGENPCTEEMAGSLDLITQAWLDWGRARGLG